MADERVYFLIFDAQFLNESAAKRSREEAALPPLDVLLKNRAIRNAGPERSASIFDRISAVGFCASKTNALVSRPFNLGTRPAALRRLALLFSILVMAASTF